MIGWWGLACMARQRKVQTSSLWVAALLRFQTHLDSCTETRNRYRISNDVDTLMTVISSCGRHNHDSWFYQKKTANWMSFLLLYPVDVVTGFLLMPVATSFVNVNWSSASFLSDCGADFKVVVTAERLWVQFQVEGLFMCSSLCLRWIEKLTLSLVVYV